MPVPPQELLEKNQQLIDTDMIISFRWGIPRGYRAGVSGKVMRW